jgi:hypothetical protein
VVGLVTTPGLLPTSIIRAISRHGCRRSNSIPSAGGTWLRSLKKKSSRRSFAPPYDRGRRDPRRESLREPEPERERERERTERALLGTMSLLTVTVTDIVPRDL